MLNIFNIFLFLQWFKEIKYQQFFCSSSDLKRLNNNSL